jgi:hypothetical protein
MQPATNPGPKPRKQPKMQTTKTPVFPSDKIIHKHFQISA